PEPKKEQIINSIYSGEVTTINYLQTASTNEFALACNLVDSLIDYDRYGVIQPALAESWSSSEDGLVWTFKIRPGVQWVNFKGEEVAEVVADDWVAAMEYVLNPDNASQTAQITYSVIKNAEKFYKKEIEDFAEVGVKAIDKYTLEYTLESPVPYFESMLNYVNFFPVNRDFLKESGVRFGTHNSTLLYNGAYILETFEPQSRRILVKNEKYWDKDQIFIERINERYNKEASAVAQELYLRGEITGLNISSAMLDEWMNDPAKLAMMRPGRPSFYTFFFALNFKPEFAAEYEPENWKVAVNNLSFRKSLFHGLNRNAAMLTHEPYNPQNRMLNTITPKNFVDSNGTDFALFEGLKKFTENESFNKDLALEFKAKAMKELEGKATFPVKVVLNYNSGSSANADRAQVLEQQLETTLGTDYIDVIILAYPPTGYLNATRRSGNYALQEVNWGPDYADPQTYTDPFDRGSNYNFPEFTTEVDENGKNKFDVYEEIVNKAIATVNDKEERYKLFAQAEGYMLENAWVIPFATGGGGYVSSSLNPFDSPYSPFGVAGLRYKGQKMMDKPMDTETFLRLQEEWEKERTEALKNANK
ncbi:MAG: peptide ABC transporter substrate-binding protein, partial [Bacillota bacterium]|nr:peptide ABC transporter substrate-binding protein [Bacillota bacterium]